ncbi:MAG: hypothetical protein P0S96_05760 [Simkaniaceae bacterium]|nr:hypothetical protein [Candidatus Sacchlamyda saccharinae]
MRIEAVFAKPTPVAPPLSTRLMQTISAVKRAVVNFFRWILSFCLPVSPRAPVCKEEIASRETRITADLFKHEVVLDGRATRNNVRFRRVGDQLHLEELSFPDSEIYAHAPTILQDLLRKEKAKGFTTHYLETARILNGSGFQSTSQITFNAVGEGKTSKAIHDIIEAAKAKRNRLGEEYVRALAAIERQLLRTSGSILDSVIGSFTDVGHRPIKIQLYDLLMLIDATNFTNTKGLSLGPDNDVEFVQMSS